MRVESLHIYPVKSLRGLSLPQLDFLDDGPRGDREFLITDLDGKFLTQRQIPAMARILASVSDAGLHLEFDGRKELLPFPAAVPAERVKVWSDSVEAFSFGTAADAVISDLVGRPARLFQYRGLEPRIRRSPRGDFFPLHFSDQAAVHLTTLESLAALNEALGPGADVPMDRFRPNIVVREAGAAWIEESWKRLRIGGAEFEVMKPADRCPIVVTDQLTGRRVSPAPLQLLKNVVKGEKASPQFGMHLRILVPGVLRVGDRVEVLAVKRRVRNLE